MRTKVSRTVAALAIVGAALVASDHPSSPTPAPAMFDPAAQLDTTQVKVIDCWLERNPDGPERVCGDVALMPSGSTPVGS